MLREELPEKDVIEQWLSTTLGKKVELKSPKKGEKLRFVEMAENNAKVTLENKEKDKSEILMELKDALKMESKSVKYGISDRGMWYDIIIKTGKRFIELRDSLKLLPFSVKRIGESFGTKHKKLEMEYNGMRYAGCPITEQEKEKQFGNW